MAKTKPDLPISTHDQLANIVGRLTSSISEGESPLGKNGELKKALDYEFQLDKFKDYFDVIFGRHFHPPDGFLVNETKKIAVVVECKSAIDEADSNLKDQLEFYDKDRKFRQIFLSDFADNEILIVCCKDYFDQICNVLGNCQIHTNCVVWTVSKQTSEDFFIQKEHGDHRDLDLNEKMSEGLHEPPATSVYFMSPHTPIQRLTAVVALRLLVNVSTSFKSTTGVDEFIERQHDLVFSIKTMKRAIRYVFKLIPELGKLKEDNKVVEFKQNARHEKIKPKIKETYNSSKVEFEERLKKAREEVRKKTRRRKKILKGQMTLDKWPE